MDRWMDGCLDGWMIAIGWIDVWMIGPHGMTPSNQAKCIEYGFALFEET